MCRAILAAVLVLAAFVSAQEQPYVPGQASAVSTHSVRLDRMTARPVQAQSPVEPVWTRLARMAPAERANARIGIELAANATSEALAFARNVEASWNAGRYDDALAGFESLARLTDPAEMVIGCAWRKPLPTRETNLWGSDVRIGNRDSISLVAFDVHRASGNLFTVVLSASGSGYVWAVNFSTDGGQTWSETYSWNANYEMKSLSASVLANHCYIAFGRGGAQDQAFIYRVKTSDGTQENFNNGSSYVTVFTTTAPDSVKEVALTGNQDFYNNRLYYTAITTAGNLKFFWSDSGAIAWTEIVTSVTNADRGLSACTNEGYDSLFVWASYYDKTNNLRIDADKPGDAWGNVFSSAAGAGTSLTSIGAYHDTLLCAFNYWATNYWCKYFTSYDGGATWAWLYLDPDTLTNTESPAVMLRGGGGEGAVYRYYTSTRSLRYTWRNYAGSWSTPVAISMNEPYWNRPGIQYLGSGNFGVAYLSWTTPAIRGAYFVRSDWTGVAEQRRIIVDENILSVTPNPLSGSGRLNYTLNRPADLRVQVYDRAGRVVRTLFDGHSHDGMQSLGFDAAGMAPGVYFIRADADGRVLTVPVTVVK
jgi:hypothetical protein